MFPLIVRSGDFHCICQTYSNIPRRSSTPNIHSFTPGARSVERYARQMFPLSSSLDSRQTLTKSPIRVRVCVTLRDPYMLSFLLTKRDQRNSLSMISPDPDNIFDNDSPAPTPPCSPILSCSQSSTSDVEFSGYTIPETFLTRFSVLSDVAEVSEPLKSLSVSPPTSSPIQTFTSSPLASSQSSLDAPSSNGQEKVGGPAINR